MLAGLPQWLSFPDWWSGNAELLRDFVRSPEFHPGLLVRYAGQSIFFSFLIFTADFLFGMAVMRLLASAGRTWIPPLLRAAGALAVGSGLSGLCLFFLGVFYLLQPGWILALSLIMALLGASLLHYLHAWRWSFSFLRVFRVSRKTQPVMLLVTLLFVPTLALHVLDLMMPVLEFDSTMYHMNAAKLYRETHGIPYQRGIRFNALPHMPVLLYLRHWILLRDDCLLKLVNLEFAFILLFVMAYATRELHWREAWGGGVLFLIASPVFCFNAKVEYADIAVASYLGAAGAFLFHHFRRNASLMIWPAGLTLGFAAAGKLQGIVLAGCTLFGFMVASLVARRKLASILRSVWILGLLVALSGAGWWIRSWVNTGSPFYPFLAAAGQNDVAFIFRATSVYGVGRNLGAFLLLPWHMLTVSPDKFADPFIFGIPGLLVILGVAVVWKTRGALLWRCPAALFLLVTTASFTVFWFRTSQVTRYLASLLPLMAILFLWLLGNAGFPKRVLVPATLLLAMVALPASVLTSSLFRWGLVPPVTYAEREAVLGSALPYYRAVQELNRRAGATDKTYLWFCEELHYYVRPRSYGDWFGSYEYEWVGWGLTSADQMIDRLAQAGFRFVLVDRVRTAKGGRIYAPGFLHSALLRDDLMLPEAERIYSDGRFAIYRLMERQK